MGREAERAQDAAVLEGKERRGRKRGGHGGTFAGLQNREREAGDGKKEERVSGWFIESLSGAVDLCAAEGAGGGAFI